MIVGCSSTTTIRSSDPTAKIYVDGEYRGMGEVVHTDQKIVGSTTSVRLQKDGCRPQHFTINKSEQVDVGAVIGGLLVWVPFLWTMEYKDNHNYEYVCEKQLTARR
jgi:hypothetical protein